MHWMKKQNPKNVYISAISIGEIRKGIEKKYVVDAEHSERLFRQLADTEFNYVGRILSFDQAAAHFWGQITARVPNHDIDAQIAGIALAHKAAVVTRNTKDFQAFSVALAPLGISLTVVNPFESIH